jgi:hypothetical protein
MNTGPRNPQQSKNSYPEELFLFRRGKVHLDWAVENISLFHLL